MNLDILVTGIILIAAFFILFYIGKIFNDIIHREFKLNYELTERDNVSLAIAMVGYYTGISLAIGGSLLGPSHGIVADLIDLTLYGLMGIVLVNISWFLCDKLILFKFKISDELIRDQNKGTGAVSAAMSIASGFILYGSIQGQGGSVWTVLAFWGMGQGVLVVAGLLYELITPYSIHDEIEKDNVAAGVSFAGAIIGIGIIIGLAADADFESWYDNTFDFLTYAAVGLVMLPIIHFLTDKVLLPGVTLRDEIAGQEVPNVGAAFIEAFSYIIAAFVFYWCV